MPISISTFASGAVVSAEEIRVRSKAIEDYVNGGIVAADRTTNWLKAGNVYTPDFQYGSGGNARLPMTGGQLHWGILPGDPNLMPVFTWQAGSGYAMVPGLTRTIQVPEASGSRYRALILASFWVYEYGGGAVGGTTAVNIPFMDELTYGAGTAALAINGVAVSATSRPFYSSSDSTAVAGGGAASGEVYCHKQFGIVYPYNWSTSHIFSAGICISSSAPADNQWKHIFVREGSLYVRYRLR